MSDLDQTKATALDMALRLVLDPEVDTGNNDVADYTVKVAVKFEAFLRGGVA